MKFKKSSELKCISVIGRTWELFHIFEQILAQKRIFAERKMTFKTIFEHAALN